MSGIRINARQRKVIKIVLVCVAALLLLGLILDAVEGATSGLSRADWALLDKYSASTSLDSSPGGGGGSYRGGFEISAMIPIVLRSPRLYIAGFLIGLAVFIHRGPKDEKA